MAQQEGEERISGATARLQPWQIAVIGGVIVLTIAMIPTFNRLVTQQRQHDATAALLAGGGGGETWHPPAYPAPEVESAAITKAAAAQSLPPAAQVEAPHLGVNNGGPPDQRMFGQRGAVPARVEGEASATPGAQGGTASINDNLGGLLKPTELSGFRATRITKPWATIEQGRVIACNSVTAMTSGLPGFVKAKVLYDVLSADGTTTLIDRNSDIFGEIAHGLVQGQDRLFVLWRQITTPPPNLVRVTLNSPAADELGEAGLPGDINHHVWQKIGGALLLSGIDATLQGASLGLAAALAGGNNGGLSYYNIGSQGQSLASSLLEHTIAIPDVLHRDQAQSCSIFVTGDLDFSGVYNLRISR